MLQQNKPILAVAIGALFIFALSAAPVIAHGPDHDDNHDQCKHCEKKIAKMDTDSDGKISRREFMKFHGDKFDKYDLNNDRFLDADEIHYMMEDMHKHKRGDDHGHDDGHGHSHDNDNDDDDDNGHEHSHSHNHD
ncbi:MAG: hypothetical protein KF888_08990 [Nitrosomonas sp.]|nr:hypothetical protein [Nitrosomonas sp.]